MRTPHPVELSSLQRRLATNRFGSWLGLELVAATPGNITMRCPWRDEFISNPVREAVHGGILATLVDSAAIYAVIAAINSMAATVDLRVDYHGKPARGAFTVTGTPVRIGRSLATAEARVFDSGNKLVASGRGVFIRLDEPIEFAMDPTPATG